MNSILSLLAQAQQPSPLMEKVDWLARRPLSHLVIFVAVLTALRLIVIPLIQKMPRHLRSGPKHGIMKFVNETADALIYAGGLVFLVIRPFAIQTFFVPSESMLDTLRINDFLIGNKAIYRRQEPRSGEIVVFRPPPEALNPGEDKYFIKRLIGCPGDMVEIRQGDLYLNGKRIEEKYSTLGKSMWDFKLIQDKGEYVPIVIESDGSINVRGSASKFLAGTQAPGTEERWRAAPPVAIPPGKFLMLGDNRNGSLDSRFWGLVERRNIIARAEWMWRPPRQIGQLEHPIIKN